MKTNHTPTPWHLIQTERNDMVISYSDGELRSHIATCHDQALCPEHGTVKANAEFIVRACNHHEELVAALKNLLPAFDNESTRAIAQVYAPELATARAVLAKIESENR